MRTVWCLILFGSLIIHHCFTTVSGEGTPAVAAAETGEAQPSYSQCKPYVDAALKGDIPTEPPPPSESQVEKPPDGEDENNTSEGTTEEDSDESKEHKRNPPVKPSEPPKGGVEEDDNNTSEGTTEEDDDESKEHKRKPAAPKAEAPKDEDNTSEGTTEEDSDESKEHKRAAKAETAKAAPAVEEENNTSEGTTEEDDDESKEHKRKPPQKPEQPKEAEDENNTSEGTTEEDSDESKEHKRVPPKPKAEEAKKDADDEDDSHEGEVIDEEEKAPVKSKVKKAEPNTSEGTTEEDQDESHAERNTSEGTTEEDQDESHAERNTSEGTTEEDQDESHAERNTSEGTTEEDQDESHAERNTSEGTTEEDEDESHAKEEGGKRDSKDRAGKPTGKTTDKKAKRDGAVPSPLADETNESDSSESKEKEVEKTKTPSKKSESHAAVKPKEKAKTKAPPPKPVEESDESGSEEDDDDDSESDEDSYTPRSRDHLTKILGLDDSDSTMETFAMLQRATQTTLKDLKSTYESAIKPLEILYKYRDLSNRHFGDPEIFSKPLVVFMGPWSGGKSTIINWLLGIQDQENALRTGADPSPAQFNIMIWGEEDEVLDGTQLAADWTFSGLQKFGQNFLDRLRGRKLPTRLLEKVNLVEIPGILEIRKQVERAFPFNDACQWFIDRADLLFLVYDPAKLDIGPETEAILDQLKGRENQVRIILNKADTVKPEELLRVQATLVWNISPLMSSSEPPILYAASLWDRPLQSDSPISLLTSHENLFLKDIRDATEKRVETRIAAARRFAVRVRNHAKMCDCYLNTYNNHRSFFSNKKKISDDIIDHPQNYHIYEGLSTLTNISRYDLPDPDSYRDFFRLNPLWEFPTLASTCTYFKGCPINKLDIAIAYELPELLGKFRRQRESIIGASSAPKVIVPGTPPKAGAKWKIEVIEPPAPPPSSAGGKPVNRWKKDVPEDEPKAKAAAAAPPPSPPTPSKPKWKKDVVEETPKAPTPTPATPSPSQPPKNKWKKDVEEEVAAPAPSSPATPSPTPAKPKNRWKTEVEEDEPATPPPPAPKNKWRKDVEEETPKEAAPAATPSPAPAKPKNRWKTEVEEDEEPTPPPPPPPKNRWKKEE